MDYQCEVFKLDCENTSGLTEHIFNEHKGESEKMNTHLTIENSIERSHRWKRK